MKRIGILFGQESTFPQAFIERVNAQACRDGIVAEPVRIDKLMQGEDSGYAVIARPHLARTSPSTAPT